MPRAYLSKVDDYVPVTSFSHHPYYETFAVEVPDNWLWAQYYNVPLTNLRQSLTIHLPKATPLYGLPT